MIFKFLKYIKPVDYFSLPNNSEIFIYPDPFEMPENLKKKFNSDNGYVSNISTEYDISYQMIQSGFIGDIKRIRTFKKIPIRDEYRFVKKYFGLKWLIYVLICRLSSFKNPFVEVHSFLKSVNVTKYKIYQKHFQYSRWDKYKSELIMEKPKVSVIIPTLNRYIFLKDVLFDLEQQDYKNFDVIIFDQSDIFNSKFYENFKLNIKVNYQSIKALWLARNNAIKFSDADFLLFFDDDSRVDSNWISNHLKCLDFFKADISSGVSLSSVGAEVPKNYTYFKYSNQLDTGNSLIKRSVFNEIGLFDRQFEKQRMGDGEFGLRAYLNGFINISNPKSKRIHLKANTGGLRSMGLWDAFRTNNFLGPRPIPSVLYFYRTYFSFESIVHGLIIQLPKSIIPYYMKGSKILNILSFFLILISFPLLIIGLSKSWKISSNMLNEGFK